MRFLDRPYAGTVGEIRYIYRSWVFVYSRTHVENAGIMVAKSKQVELVGVSRNKDGELPSSSRPAVQQLGGGRRGGGRGGGGQRRRDGNQVDRSLIGKSARIIAVSPTLSVLSCFLLLCAKMIEIILYNPTRNISVLIITYQEKLPNS